MERLQKIISAAGIASRRKAEEFITSGRVQVNGQTVTELGAKADAEKDHIRVDGKLIKRVDHHVYILLNKPKGYVTTLSDPEGRPTIVDLLRGVKARVYPVGRLDYASEGLLLLTNDGEMANALTKAASHVPKTYLVKVDGQPDDAAIERLRLGISLPDRKGVQTRTAPAGIQLVHKAENPWYEVTLIEGRNRQVRKMFEETGHHVEKLKRVRYGPFTLDVHPGKFRYLNTEEIEQLRAAIQRGASMPEQTPEETRITLDAHIASDTRTAESNREDFQDELDNALEPSTESTFPPRKSVRSSRSVTVEKEPVESKGRAVRPAAPFQAAPFKAGSFKPRTGGPRDAKSPRRDGFKRNDFRKFDARRAEAQEASPNDRKPSMGKARLETGASPVRSYPPSRPRSASSGAPGNASFRPERAQRRTPGSAPSRAAGRPERPAWKKPSGQRSGTFAGRPSAGRPSAGPPKKWAGRPASSEGADPRGGQRPNSFRTREDRPRSARPVAGGPRSGRPAGRSFERPSGAGSDSGPRPEFRTQRPDWKKSSAARADFPGGARPMKARPISAGPSARTPRSGRPSDKPGKWVKGVSASIERPAPRVAKAREEFRPKNTVREREPRSEEGAGSAAPRKNQAQPFWKKATEKRVRSKGKKNRPR